MPIDLVAPFVCVGCAATSDAELCASCAEGVLLVERPWCERCGTPGESSSGACNACASLAGFDRARSLVAFVEPARRLTLALKRRGRPGLARSMGELIGALVRREGIADVDAVAWAPAGGAARRVGFDHTELLARGCASAIAVPARRLLRRTADGPRQADVSLADRRSNVRGRFASAGSPARVLLVDDVFTTGATAEACSGALRAAGASVVHVVTWARTLLRRPRSVGMWRAEVGLYSSGEPHPLGARGQARRPAPRVCDRQALEGRTVLRSHHQDGGRAAPGA